MCDSSLDGTEEQLSSQKWVKITGLESASFCYKIAAIAVMWLCVRCEAVPYNIAFQLQEFLAACLRGEGRKLHKLGGFY